MSVVLTPQQNKMQTEEEEQKGDGQKEAEEKTPRENEEMEVICDIFSDKQDLFCILSFTCRKQFNTIAHNTFSLRTYN